MKYLIVDLNITLNGHKFGFVNNLLHYAGEHRPGDEFIFLVNRSADFRLESRYAHVQVILPTEEEQQRVQNQPGLLKKSAAEWALIDREARRHRCGRLILMELDLYQVALGRSTTPYKISGIWFRPYSRMEPEGPGLFQKIRFWRSKLQKKGVMKLALRNASLDKVFILNDEQMPAWLDENRFFTLPDPWFDYPIAQDFDLRKHYDIPENHLILLQFGYADERKNNENIIRALNELPHSDITLLIIGRFKPGYEEELKKLKTGPFRMITRDEFISDEEMESTFQQSDVILRMNVNYFGSSGVVGIAARYNKPVMVSDTGVMAELVVKYRLGDVVNPSDTADIRALFLQYRQSLPAVDGSTYRDTHDLRAFAETLLEDGL